MKTRLNRHSGRARHGARRGQRSAGGKAAGIWRAALWKCKSGSAEPHPQGKTMTKTIPLCAAGQRHLLSGRPLAQDVTLTIESWRNGDPDHLAERSFRLQAAQSRHQGRFRALGAGGIQCRAELKLDAGSAGDLITCRPFDASLELFNRANLPIWSAMPAMANFSDVAKSRPDG